MTFIQPVWFKAELPKPVVMDFIAEHQQKCIV
jgi:hypothetical protein